MRGLEITKRVCFSPLLYYTTYKCKHILSKASSHFDLCPLQKKKKKKGQVKHWGSQENDISCTPVRTTITNPNKPTATYNSRRSRAWVQLYNHNHDYHHLFWNSQFMKFINSLKHLFSSYYVLGTMLPVGPTEMNKDLNIKFCFQKQMSCSRTWTKKWGQVRTQYNGYYSKTKTQKTTSVGEDTEILEPLCIASKNVKWSSCYTKQFGGSSKN